MFFTSPNSGMGGDPRRKGVRWLGMQGGKQRAAAGQRQRASKAHAAEQTESSKKFAGPRFCQRADVRMAAVPGAARGGRGAPANASCTSSSCASSCTPVTSSTQPSTAARAGIELIRVRLQARRRRGGSGKRFCVCRGSHFAGPGPLSVGSASNCPPCSLSSSDTASRKPRPCTGNEPRAA